MSFNRGQIDIKCFLGRDFSRNECGRRRARKSPSDRAKSGTIGHVQERSLFQNYLRVYTYWGFASMGPYLFMTYKGFSGAAAGEFFGVIYGIGGLSSVILGHFADRFGRKPVILLMAFLNAVCGWLIFHFIPSGNLSMLYVVGGVLGIGLHAIYILGYTVGQDAVETRQVGLATGLIGAATYFTSFFSGPATGYLTKQYGHLVALDIIVVAFEAALILLALFMPETLKRRENTPSGQVSSPSA